MGNGGDVYKMAVVVGCAFAQHEAQNGLGQKKTETEPLGSILGALV